MWTNAWMRIVKVYSWIMNVIQDVKKKKKESLKSKWNNTEHEEFRKSNKRAKVKSMATRLDHAEDRVSGQDKREKTDYWVKENVQS